VFLFYIKLSSIYIVFAFSYCSTILLLENLKFSTFAIMFRFWNFRNCFVYSSLYKESLNLAQHRNYITNVYFFCFKNFSFLKKLCFIRKHSRFFVFLLWFYVFNKVLNNYRSKNNCFLLHSFTGRTFLFGFSFYLLL